MANGEAEEVVPGGVKLAVVSWRPDDGRRQGLHGEVDGGVGVLGEGGVEAMAVVEVALDLMRRKSRCSGARRWGRRTP